ncbi:hypothetical protein [Nocardioides terrisoli]|uniref:hypothetical protein n=1 Tax=Nocardioides terrisoli TaxID=3388267 RepID=UPI00287BAB23|nr:hypothetical protein [Nocardioides marmorisolisilvae]
MDPLDVELEDSALLSEVEITAALIVAANQAKGPLSLAEIDAVLGLPDRSETTPIDSGPAPSGRAQAQ